MQGRQDQASESPHRRFGKSPRQSGETLDEIAANDHNLNIPRCGEPKVEREMLTLTFGAAVWRSRDDALATR